MTGNRWINETGLRLAGAFLKNAEVGAMTQVIIDITIQNQEEENHWNKRFERLLAGTDYLVCKR